MASLYAYLSEDELLIAQESAMVENEAMKFDHQFQILALEHEMRLHDIDTKALLDNYTEAVLEDAYTDELRVYEEGVKEAWEAFKKWFIDLINKILGKTKMEELPQEEKAKKFSLPFDVSFVGKKIGEIADNFKNIFKKEDGSVDTGKTAATLAATFVGGVGIFKAVEALKDHLAEKKETEITAENAQKALPVIEKALNKIKSIFGQHKEEDGTDTHAATLAINSIQTVVNTIRGKLAAVVKGAKEKAANVAGAVKAKVDAAKDKAEEVKEESTNDLLASMEEIEFMQESGLDDMITESASAEDMKAISDILDTL